MKNYIEKYIENLKIPRHHKISLNYPYLKLCHQDLYLCGDIVFSNFDKISVINIKKFNLDFKGVKKIVDNFIVNAKKRNNTRPYQIKTLQDIDNIDYSNIWDFYYSDEGLKDRWLNGEGRCEY